MRSRRPSAGSWCSRSPPFASSASGSPSGLPRSSSLASPTLRATRRAPSCSSSPAARSPGLARRPFSASCRPTWRTLRPWPTRASASLSSTRPSRSALRSGTSSAPCSQRGRAGGGPSSSRRRRWRPSQRSPFASLPPRPSPRGRPPPPRCSPPRRHCSSRRSRRPLPRTRRWLPSPRVPTARSAPLAAAAPPAARARLR
mmetsp:Transcript_22126/g.70701  ORF Transcript_22126/g.70701 Transcript_22126/m.70701 type:complete len:200 (-) Transcript_22126:1130-1729(-)